MRLWNLQTREERMSFNPHGAVASAEFSPDGRWLVTAGWDHTARIWNVQTGRAEHKLLGQHTDDINDAVFSPDGRQVLTASDDGTAVLWNIETESPAVILRGHGKRINSAVFSQDGRWILTASDDRTARVWDAKTGKELLVLKGHEWAVQSAEFSKDGQRIITAGDDNTARVWKLTKPVAQNGSEIGPPNPGGCSKGTRRAWSPGDSRRTAGGSSPAAGTTPRSSGTPTPARNS